MNRNLPLVSVVVPVYNVQDYIELSIKSICEQTYPNIEIIIVDDQSKDDSINKAKRVLEKYTVPYKIITEINKGLPGARNTGIFYSKGDYICFIDSDDLISKEHVQLLVDLMINESLKVCFSGFEITDMGNRIGRNLIKYKTKVFTKNELFNFFVLRKPAIHCCSLLIDNNYLKNKHIYFNEKLRYGEDAEYMWRLFSFVDRIGDAKSYTYKYLLRDNSIMSSINIEKGIVFQKEFLKSLERLKITYPKYSKYYDWAYYRNVLGWVHSVAINSTYKDFKLCLQTVSMNSLYQNLINFPDIKIKILVIILKFFPHLFYSVFRRGVR